MKANIDKSEIPLKSTEKLSPDEERLIEIFDDLRRKQLEFLDQAGTRIIELSTGLLGLLFAVIAFGEDFPPPYLINNRITIWESALVLACLMVGCKIKVDHFFSRLKNLNISFSTSH